MTDTETTLILVALFCVGPILATGIIIVLRAVFGGKHEPSFSRLPEAHNQRRPMYYTENPNRGGCQYLVSDGVAAAVCAPSRRHMLTMTGGIEPVHVTLNEWEHARYAAAGDNYTAQVAHDRNDAHERGEQAAYDYRIAQQLAAANAPYDERTYGYNNVQQRASVDMLQHAVDHDRKYHRDIAEYLPHEQAALPSGEDTHYTADWREVDTPALSDGRDYVPYTVPARTSEPRAWELENWHEGKR